MRKFLPTIFFIILFLAFFSPFVFQNKLPIPSDTIVGLYHPFRDAYIKDYPNGIPFKNFLITDPVRQQYLWRNLSAETEKRFELPLWNPYNFAGTPLLANFQSAVFYPLNLIFLIFPFSLGWSFLILLQPLLAGVFLYLYLNNLKINRYSSLLGAISFAFSGFSIAWLEWGTVGHTALWLPLVLLSIDKLFFHSGHLKISNFKPALPAGRFLISNNKIRIWSLIFLFSLTPSFFAGHLQTFFYLFLISAVYFFVRWLQSGRAKNVLSLFIILISLFFIITLVQWLPTLQFILLSARGMDQDWHNEGWFIPWQNLVQFIAPDFFGNPATLNYWGMWNYAEFVGYIGIFPFIMAIFAMFNRRDKKTFFFGSIFFLSLIFSLPTIFAKIPYILQIPFLSTSQPTRLLFLTNFSLAVLAALGSDLLIRNYQRKQIIYVLLFFLVVFAGLWIFVLIGINLFTGITPENLLVAKRNLFFPTLVFAISVALIFAWDRLSKTNSSIIILLCIVITVVFDLLRFGTKFTPFTSKEFLFPTTKTIDFLQKQKGQFRIMSTDDRILPPNFSIAFHLQSIAGYDPLYLLSYGELIAASERNGPNISPPFGFNRIITPHNYESKIIDLLGVKFVLSLDDIHSPKLKKVFQEGKTRVYENNKALPRSFFVGKIKLVNDKQSAIEELLDQDNSPQRLAVVLDPRSITLSDKFEIGTVAISQYTTNRLIINTRNKGHGFLVLMDTFYPTWHAKICSMAESSCQDTKIYLTNYNFRGIEVPKGDHRVIFENSLL